MKYNKEDILKRSFEVFMNEGYDSASISVLQSELGMSRGAMYRYFKNKEELFISVVDRYIFDALNRLLFKNLEILTVPILIDNLFRRQSVYLRLFSRLGVTHDIFLNYTALIIQAAKYYPGFVGLFNNIHRRFYIIWKLAIRKSILLREVKPDTDIEITGRLFANMFFQEEGGQYPVNKYDDLKFNQKLKDDLIMRKQTLDYLYHLIKV